MKLLQARIPEAEYALVRREARRKGMTLQAVVRASLRAWLLDDRVDGKDPFFSAFPLVKARGRRRENIAARHDEILYEGRS